MIQKGQLMDDLQIIASVANKSTQDWRLALQICREFVKNRMSCLEYVGRQGEKYYRGTVFMYPEMVLEISELSDITTVFLDY